MLYEPKNRTTWRQGGALAWWLGRRIPESEREVGGSILTRVTVLCPWARHIFPKSTGNTQEAVAPSQHD